MEKIEFGGCDWLVLDKKDGNTLILREKLGEPKPYNAEATNVTWETCDLRKYLNGDYFSRFSAEEQARIVEVTNTNKDNQWFDDGKGGNDTIDKIFLLSIEEVVTYFGDSGQLANGKPDEDDEDYDEEYYVDGEAELHDMYSEERIAYDEDGEAQFWWLRSPGSDNEEAALVSDEGLISLACWEVSEDDDGYTKMCVRPALWIKSE